jgi:DNA-binding IclR family transcriptional regulator
MADKLWPKAKSKQILGKPSEVAGSFHRAVVLTRAVARGGGEGAALKDLVSWTMLPRPTIHRVLDMLIEAGWIERDAKTRRFHLGAELATLGRVAALRHSLESAVTTELALLAREIGQTIYLIVRAGLDGVCVAREESASPIQTLVLKIGSHVPLGWGAGGMAILTALPEDEAARIVASNQARYARLPSFSKIAFDKAVQESRRLGFASHDGLFTRGIGGIGVPIRDLSGYPLAAISTAFVSDWLDQEKRVHCAAKLKSAAARIAARYVDRQAQQS